MALMEEYLDAHLNLNGASEYSNNKIRYTYYCHGPNGRIFRCQFKFKRCI
jgi:hypothetical protein